MREILNGGDSVGPPTLTRFYIIHVVLLPLALVFLLLPHFALIQRHGVAAPRRRVGDEGTPGKPYFPNHVFKEALVGVAVAGGLVAIAFTQAAPLEALAEPSDTGYDPRPDWYFLPAFQLLKLFKGPMEALGVFWLPNGLLVLLLLLPFIDRTKERHWRKRPIATVLGVLMILATGALTVAGFLDKPENKATLSYKLGLTDIERQGYLLVRRSNCVDCHAHGAIGGTNEDSEDLPTLYDLSANEPTDILAVLEDPEDVLGDTEMPDFSHLSDQERYSIAAYLQTIEDPEVPK